MRITIPLIRLSGLARFPGCSLAKLRLPALGHLRPARGGCRIESGGRAEKRWQETSAARVSLTLLRLGVGIGLLVYLTRSKLVDFHSLTRLVSAWPISLAAVALLLIDLSLMAWRLCCLFSAQEMRLPWSDSLRLTAVSSFFSIFLPGRAGGDVAKIFYASKGNSGRRTEIVAILLFDRALGLFSLLLLPLLLAPLFPHVLRSTAVRIALSVVGFLALSMVTAFLACAFAMPLVARFIKGTIRILPGKDLPRGERMGRFLGTVGAYRRNPARLGEALGISLADNFTGIAVLALALLVVNPSSLAPRFVVMVPIGQIINSLPITPGGLGVGETAFRSLFSMVGLKGGAEALLCWRVWNALIGLLGWIVYLVGFRARILRASVPGESVPAILREQ